MRGDVADAEGAGEEHQEGADKEHQGVGKEHQGADKEHQGADKEHQGVGKEHQGAGKEHQGVGKEHQGVGKEHQGADKKRQKDSDKEHQEGTRKAGQEGVFDCLDKDCVEARCAERVGQQSLEKVMFYILRIECVFCYSMSRVRPRGRPLFFLVYCVTWVIHKRGASTSRDFYGTWKSLGGRLRATKRLHASLALVTVFVRATATVPAAHSTNCCCASEHEPAIK